MAKNINWTQQNLKDKGIAQNSEGVYVPVKSLVAKGKIEKFSLLKEMQTVVSDHTSAFAEYIKPNTPGYFRLPDGINIWVRHLFDIVPCPAPRLTRRDAIFLDPEHKDPAKRQRACVTRYFAFKREFVRQASINGFVLDETLRVLFILPMPKTWSKKKCLVWNNMPHKQKPDVDNCTKSVMDAGGTDDGYVWDIRAIKLWGERGAIIIF